jgi:membrane-associated phospholipid phosphatase
MTPLLIPPGVFAALGMSLAGLLLGLAWKAQRINAQDLRWAEAIHHARLPGWLDRLIVLLRPLGRSWFSWGAVLVTALASPRASVVLALAVALAAAVERGVKLLANRPRPFKVLPEIRPPPGLTPTDPSYPSGDATRAWLLAVFLATLIGMPPLSTGACVAAACLVAFGRVRLGVHSPLDVLAGSCLGAGLGWAGALVLAQPF